MTWAPFSFKVTRTFKIRLPTTLERNTPFFVSCQFVYVAPKTHQEAPSMLTYHHLAHQPPNCSTAQAVESASYNEVGRPNHIPQPAFQSSLQIQPGVQQRLSPPLHQSLSPNQPPPSPQPRQPSSPQKTSPSLNQQLPNPRKTQPTSPQSSPQTEPPPLSACFSYFSTKPLISIASPISSPIKRRKKRTSLSCQHCRKRKVKCSGEHPCIRCERGGKECVYPQRKVQASSIRKRVSQKELCPQPPSTLVHEPQLIEKLDPHLLHVADHSADSRPVSVPELVSGIGAVVELNEDQPSASQFPFDHGYGYHQLPQQYQTPLSPLHPPQRPRKRARAACSNCRIHKSRCNKEKPSCSRCETRHEECEYTEIEVSDTFLSVALKAVLEDNSTELDKVQEKWDKDLGKEDKSRLLINALSLMLKKLEGQEKQLKEQKQRQKAQEEQLSLQKEQLDRLSWLSVWLDQTNEMRTQ